jgi:Mn2+/Fe2+ NRAMP family transporter
MGQNLPGGCHLEEFMARRDAKKPAAKNGLLKRLGPGLITGASDDDPSGIGTYSQAGAQLGFGIA